MFENTTEFWPGVLAGCILGDGSVEGNRVVIAHTSPQHNYVVYKNNLFRGMGLRTSTRYKDSKETNLGTYYYSRVSVWAPEQYLLNMHFLDLIHILNPMGLLLWWLDDGSLTVHHKRNGTSVSRFGQLSTHRFSYEDNIRIKNALYDKFGLETRVHKDGATDLGKQPHYYRIYLNATNMRKLIDIVRPYIAGIPNDMKYKFNMQYVVTRTLASHEYMKWYNF